MTPPNPPSSPPAEPAHPAPAAAELPKGYVPADHEPRIREAWERAAAFHPDPERVLRGEARPYCIFIPPPNVTGVLHLGHALNNTLQDILARTHRMRGHETLWMPGTDHAGIATQAVVERRLRKDSLLKGPLKDATKNGGWTRDKFIAQVQQWKDEYEATITNQLKAMGCSCDWDRQRFTMDPQCAAAVYEAFFRLFKDGLIYRGKRLVNWDPALQTAVADDETEDVEVDGQFYYLRYPLVHPRGATTATERRRHQAAPGDAVPVTWSELRARGWPPSLTVDDADHDDEKQAWVTVATTRPETYLGDAAVAVHPRDPRWRALEGLCVELPLVGRVIPLIADDYVVLPAALAPEGGDEDARDDEAKSQKAQFATGFLKVTPAHDANDYALWERHKPAMAHLPSGGLINIMAPDASISDQHGWTDVGGAHVFVGLKREDARKKVVAEFKAHTVGGEPGAASLFARSVPYRHSVPHSDRSKAAIEPYLSDQWYVRVTDPRLAQSANAALTPDVGLTFHPARYAKTYQTWHDNIRDWCISRQLWWGHQIPVWTNLGVSGDHDAIQRWNAVRSRWEREGRIVVGSTTFGNASELARASRAREEFSQTGQGLANVELTRDAFTDTFVAVKSPDDTEVIQTLEDVGFTRDPDVLDTWFSSALWPLSTLGWPQDTPLLRAFNPSSVLSTAREIITLWVSRMVMFNRYLHGPGGGRGPVPFKDVFIHAVVQDGEGKRMSKSAGNGVDPLDIIASHGADAMRFTLCQMTTQTQDVRMPVVKDPKTGRNTSPKFDLGRNFCNKLWNAARYAMSLGGSDGVTKARSDEGPAAASLRHSVTASLSLPDRWLLSRLAAGVEAVNAALANYEFSEYAQIVYDLLWRDFCDWYLEAIKPTVAADAAQRAVLMHALETIVRLLHPVLPFVTEAIWERLRHAQSAPIEGITLAPPRSGGLLCTAGWPEVAASWRNHAAEAEFAAVQQLVTAIREVRAQHNVPPKRKLTLHLPAALRQTIRPNDGLIQTLAGVEAIVDAAPAGPAVPFTLAAIECQLSNLADAVDASAERTRLEKVIVDAEKAIATLNGRLSNPGYVDRAPPAMVEQTRGQLAKATAERDAARAALEKLR